MRPAWASAEGQRGQAMSSRCSIYRGMQDMAVPPALSTCKCQLHCFRMALTAARCARPCEC